MPELAALSISETPLNTGGVSQAAADTSYFRALADMRELRIPFVTPQLYPLENGDLLIKDAPLLAEGEWIDSAVKTPLYYTAKALEQFAGNWTKKTGHNRHLKGQPRDESNRVSEAINPHYGQFQDDTGAVHNAVLSDILVYGSTPSGRAMQELIRTKNIKFLSVEHGGDERWNPATSRMETATLEFYGYAHVNKGACAVCRVNEAAEPAQEAEHPVIVPEDNSMEVKELEAQVATLTKELSEIKAAKPAVVTVDVPKELAALPAVIKELADGMAAVSKRIDALEKDGTPATSTTKELEAMPEFYIPVDRKKGTIGE